MVRVYSTYYYYVTCGSPLRGLQKMPIGALFDIKMEAHTVVGGRGCLLCDPGFEVRGEGNKREKYTSEGSKWDGNRHNRIHIKLAGKKTVYENNYCTVRPIDETPLAYARRSVKRKGMPI